LPQGDDARLPALAGQRDRGRSVGAQVADGAVDQFLDARAGVVEHLQQRGVPGPDEGRGVRNGLDRVHFPRVQAGRGPVVGLLLPDGLDLLVLVHQLGDRPGQEVEEGLDGR
jgi:hypothetical protein